MPIIPLLQSPGPISALPAPVLDRQRRPTVNLGRQIGAAGNLGAASQMPLDGIDYAAPMRALGAVGEAVARTGSVLGALAMKRQEATDRRLVNQAQSAMDQAALEFRSWQEANPNAPEAWVEEARKRSEAIMQPFLGMKELSNAAKGDLQLMGQSWQQRFVGGVDVEATKATFGLAKQSYVQRAERAFESGDEATGRAALSEAKAAGYLHDVDFEMLEAKGAETIKRNRERDVSARLETAVRLGDEKLLEQAVKDGKAIAGWSDDQAEAKRLAGLDGVRATQERNQNLAESEFFGDIVMRKAQGEVFAPTQVDEWVKEGRIDKQTGARLRVALKSEQGAVTGELMDFLNKEVDAYDPDDDPQFTKLYEINQKATLLGLNTDQANLFNMRLQRAAKVNADPKAKPLEAVRRAAKSQIGEMFKDVGTQRVWNKDLEMALRDAVKLEAYGLPADQAAKVKLLIEGGKDKKGILGKAGNTIMPDKSAALRLFRDQSTARKERGESGLSEWEYELFSTAADTSKDAVTDPRRAMESEFDRAVIEEAFDNWYDNETAKRGAPPTEKEAAAWVGDKTRAVIQGGALKNLFGAAPKAESPTAATTTGISIRGFQDAPDLAEKLPEGLAPYASAFVEAARDNGLDPYALAAISMHETANGTSKAFREKNNAMGISDSSGPTTQESVEASIKRMARFLAGKTYAKASTLDEIGRIYAPVGAGNDPKKLNSYWPGGVASHYARLKN
jgi:hypothetical protein